MISLIFTSLLWAQPIVIQSTKTPTIAYEKYLMKHPRQQSFVQYYQSIDKSLKAEVYELFKKAQFNFLNAAVKDAHLTFQKIVELQHKLDWNQKERAIIHFSFLRLAQLELNKTNQETLLKRAISFNPKAKIDTTVFPPPLVKKYQKLKTQVKPQIWPLPKNSNQFDTVLINGVEQKSHSSFLRLYPSLKRITFLSNRYAPISLTTTPEKLETIDLTLTPLASGSCLKPIFNTNLETKRSLVLLDEQCHSRQMLAKKTPLALPSPQTRRQGSSSPQFYKNKWFWAGVSVVAAGFAYSHLQKQKPSSPTATVSPAGVQSFTNK